MTCAVCSAAIDHGCIRCGAPICASHQVTTGVCAACGQPWPAAARYAAFVAAALGLVGLFAAAAAALARSGPGNRYNFHNGGADGWAYLAVVLGAAALVAAPLLWLRVGRHIARRSAAAIPAARSVSSSSSRAR